MIDENKFKELCSLIKGPGRWDPIRTLLEIQENAGANLLHQWPEIKDTLESLWKENSELKASHKSAYNQGCNDGLEKAARIAALEEAANEAEHYIREWTWRKWIAPEHTEDRERLAVEVKEKIRALVNKP
jgi:hypothetical protein